MLFKYHIILILYYFGFKLNLAQGFNLANLTPGEKQKLPLPRVVPKQKISVKEGETVLFACKGKFKIRFRKSIFAI